MVVVGPLSSRPAAAAVTAVHPCRDLQVRLPISRHTGAAAPDENMICGNAALLYESPDESNGRKLKFSRYVDVSRDGWRLSSYII